MGRNRVLDDVDYILTNLKDLNPSKDPPPAPQSISNFKVREINNSLTYSQGNLLENVRLDNSYAIFSLFFDDFILEILVTNINKFTELNSVLETPYARLQRPTTIAELRAYIEVYI